MFATVASLLTATVIGSYIRPLASARCSSRPIALRTDGAFTFGARRTTFAGRAVPGNACCIRSYVLTTVSDLRERVRPRRRDVELERRRREREHERPGDERRQRGPAQDAVDDRAPDPPLAVVAAEPADERDPQPVDLVAELREQGRQDGQRTEHGDGDHEDRRDAERGERAVAGQEHARHRHHHREPGDEHRAARRRGGRFQAACALRPAARSWRSRFR